MTNGEKLKETFPNLRITICEFYVQVMAEDYTFNNTYPLEWWNAEYKEPTTKNNLGVDCIDRAEVLKLMQDNWHTHNGDWAMQESMDDIRALPSVTPQEPRWIPVSEKLPNDRDWYLGIFKEPDTGWINPLPFICDYVGRETKATTKEHWILRGFTDMDEHIDYYFNLECVAWMPLPQNYEEVEEMTREEKIKGLYSLKEYLVENPIELEGHKSLSITLIDYAIEALEQESTTKNDLGVDCISRAQTQTEIEMCASRYTIAKERGGMGQVEWSDQLIKVSDAVNIIRKLPPVTPQERKGHWIDEGVYAEGHSEHAFMCSKCEKNYIGYARDLKWCPNCGSDNREVEE